MVLAPLCLSLACNGSTTQGQDVVASVDVQPEQTLLIGSGKSAVFTAVARDSDGGLVSAPVLWSIADPAVASIHQAGQASSLATGTTTVTATVEGVSGSAHLEVYVPEEVAHYTPGQSYFGRRRYVEYIPGTLPVILSAAHGGDQDPREIPNRTYGVTTADRNTKELTVAASEALVELTGEAPHVIISHLHRRKLDPNREIEEAAQGSPYAEQAWHEFHDWVRQARTAVSSDFAGGMYFDIHGHGHEVQRLELGYLLSAEDLTQPDAALDAIAVVRCTSIREIGRDSPIPFSQLLRGPISLGGLLQEEGVRSVPSPSDRSPGGQPYFRGGYNTRVHGSMTDGEVVSAIQIEHHFSGVRDTETNRQEYATKLARVIRRFMQEHFGLMESDRAGLLGTPDVAVGDLRMGASGPWNDYLHSGFIVNDSDARRPLMNGFGLPNFGGWPGFGTGFFGATIAQSEGC